MKTSFIKSLTLALSVAGMASAAPIAFIYNGSNYGIMDITYQSASSVQVQFTAADGVSGLTDFQVTGFAFDFLNSAIGGSGISISNPTAGAFADDEDGLNWTSYSGNFPQPTNSDINKSAFTFGVDEITNSTLTPPGIHMGDMDIFNLNGFQGLTAETDLNTVVTLQGIRIQAIQPGDGSLFLTGSDAPAAVPEPSTVALMGLGLLGLVAASRRRNK